MYVDVWVWISVLVYLCTHVYNCLCVCTCTHIYACKDKKEIWLCCPILFFKTGSLDGLGFTISLGCLALERRDPPACLHIPLGLSLFTTILCGYVFVFVLLFVFFSLTQALEFKLSTWLTEPCLWLSRLLREKSKPIILAAMLHGSKGSWVCTGNR